jgi:undecaprenyl-diphosphatase
MSTFEAIVLGIVQGLTEFLPISSSGHLILVPWLAGWEEPGLAFDAALHLGTLLAVFTYFRQDILGMIKAIPIALSSPKRLLFANPAELADERSRSGRLALLLVVGSLPAGIVGLAAQNAIDDRFHDHDKQPGSIAIIAALLIVFALVLLLAERIARHVRGIETLTIKDALLIGVAQALALFPGVSRSGSTLTAGLFRDLKRADAARFSFLLGTPLVLAAGLTGVKDIIDANPSGAEIWRMGIGILASAISGFAAIWVLLKFLQRSDTKIFIAYRVAAGIAILLLIAFGFRN